MCLDVTLNHDINTLVSIKVGMKMERKRTELSGVIFVLLFLCRNMNKYRNTKNKYENRYFQKQTWNEHGANTDGKQMIIGTK
jgi:hypothetical protein